MAKQSPEQIKAESRGLRGEIGVELQNTNPYFSDASDKLLKFHASTSRRIVTPASSTGPLITISSCSGPGCQAAS